jgi:PAS domain S-box-containing protein
MQPDLVLMDIRLKGDMDGVTAAEQIRASNHIPVVYLTAFADEVTMQRAKITEPYGYILKPFEEKSLHTTIEMALYRHQMEQRLKESERWMSATLNSIGEAVIATDKKGGVIFMNPVGERLTGWLQSEVLGRDCDEVFTVIDEQSRAATDNLVRKILQEGVMVESTQHVLVARDGTEISIDESAAPIRDDRDDLSGVVWTFRDITERKLVEQAVRRYADYLQVLHELDQAILTADTPEAIAQAVLHNMLQLVPCQQACLLLFDTTAKIVHVFAEGGDRPSSGKTNQSMSLAAVGALLDLKQGQSRIVQDLSALTDLSRFEHLLRGEGTRSLLSIPLIARGELVGALSLGATKPGVFSAEHVDIVFGVANQVAVAIVQATLFRETRRQAKELAVLNKAGQAMVSSLDLDTVLAQVMAEANALVSAEGTAVLLRDPASDQLIFAAAESPGADIMMGRKVPLDGSIAGWAVRENQPLLVDDAQQDSRFYDQIDTKTGLTTRSILAVPLTYRHEAIGVIEATNKRTGSFSQHDLELLEALASSAAIAIENARLFEQVQAGQGQLRRLAQQTVSAHEEERQRLSYELHDEAGQALIALKMGLELIQLDLPDDAAALGGRLGEAVVLTDQTMERLRMLARDLRPPALDAAGINSTLEGLCRDFAVRARFTIDYVGTDHLVLPDPAQICLYRFLQEALTNIAKHAQARQVLVKLHADSRTVGLVVNDDGRGFDVQTTLKRSNQLNGIGLLGMQERLELLEGWLEVQSWPGQGTRLIAYIPLEAT